MLYVVRSVTDELNKVTPAARQRSGVRHKETNLLMQIHRSRHTSGFTVLPNTLLQDRRLSYPARGLLADLLSRPDGWSEDGRHMADASPQGRLAVAKALRELRAFGYYRVDKVRRSDGTFVSETHVYDTPQVAPGLTRPGSGVPIDGERGANPVKDLGKVPSLPGQRSSAADGRGVGARVNAPGTETRDAGPGRGMRGDEPGTRARDASPAVGARSDGPAMATRGDEPGTGAGGQTETPTAKPDRGHASPPTADVHGEAVATLFRVLRPEPRLRVGMVEALALAPLVSTWLERGYGQRDLAGALLGGLPDRVHSAPAILRDRLTRKLPPAPELSLSAPVKPRWVECGGCGSPIPREGICRACAGLGDGRSDDSDHRAQVTARGRAKVRAALRGGRSSLSGASRA
ncbi:hypothetical protein [Streptomyces sp. DT195]|uniref:hypothetical protein n=1 Tax=Streptomyces sp. DT195 TaxID=3393419 RepID=UPI003CE6F85A